MYQPYPSSGGRPVQPARPEPPRSVRTAVKFMYAGAAVELLSLIASLATAGGLHNALHRARPSLTPAQLHAAVTTLIVADVVIAVISIGLWVGMALASRAGKSWARIVASVLFALDTVLVVLGLRQLSVSLSSLFNIVIWLAGLGAVVMLWRRESSAFFEAAGATRNP